MRHDPSAYGATPRSKVIGRSSDAARSWRGDLPCFTEFPYDGSGGLPRCERDDDNAAAPALHFVRSDNRRFGVIAALHNHVRLQSFDQLERSILGKDNNEIDAFHGREHEGTFRGAANRPARPLEPSHRVIAVDADDQRISGPARGAEEIDVSRVEQIEDTVGERDPILS
jgi:hypothetical protein